MWVVVNIGPRRQTGREGLPPPPVRVRSDPLVLCTLSEIVQTVRGRGGVGRRTFLPHTVSGMAGTKFIFSKAPLPPLPLPPSVSLVFSLPSLDPGREGSLGEVYFESPRV